MDAGRVSDTVARFPSQFEKKFCKIQKKFCKVTLEYFKGVRKKIFYNETKFTTKKLTFFPYCPEQNKK